MDQSNAGGPRGGPLGRVASGLAATLLGCLIAIGCQGVGQTGRHNLLSEHAGGLVGSLARATKAHPPETRTLAESPDTSEHDDAAPREASPQVIVSRVGDPARVEAVATASKPGAVSIGAPVAHVASAVETPTSRTAIDFAEHMVQAKAFALAGQFADAEEVYKILIEAFPNRFEPYYHLAVIADCRGRYSQAITWYRQAVQLQPNAADVHHDLGHCLLEQQRYAEAEEALATAVRLAPTETLYRESLAVACAKQNRFTDALLHLTPVMKDADAYYRVAILLGEENNIEGMKECLVLALESNPTHAGSLSKLMELAEAERQRAQRDTAQSRNAPPAATFSDAATPQLLLVPASANAVSTGQPAVPGIAFGRDVLRDVDTANTAGAAPTEVRYPTDSDALLAGAESRVRIEEVALRQPQEIMSR